MAEQLLTLNQVMDYNLRYLVGTRSTAKSVLAKGSTASRITSTNAFAYTIAGQQYSKSAITNAQWGTLATSGVELATQAAGTNHWYCISLDAAGNLRITQGLNGKGRPDPYTSTTTGTFDTCVVGYINVVTANAATFDPGTTNFDATDVTSTFYDAAIPF